MLATLAALSLGVADPIPRIELLGTVAIAGDERDRSRLRTLVGTTPHSRLGSFGSGIDYTGAGDLYLACDDRGPGDGAFEFRCRVQSLRITIDSDAKAEYRVAAEVVATTLLSDERGTPLTGLAAAIDSSSTPHLWPRFDPEGIRILNPATAEMLSAPRGAFVISDEYGPAIDLFAPDGRRLQRFDIPQSFRIDRASADPTEELPPHNLRGRQANRGFEGLAISPTGDKLFAIAQSPLIQDHALSPGNKRRGVHVRILELEIPTGRTRQFIYTLASPKLGISELLAIDDHRMLVLERDGEGGEEARSRAIYQIDLAAATDISTTPALPERDLPAEIIPVAKRPFLDLLDPRYALAGKNMPEKIEGLTFGPTLPDGRRTLIVTSDNDLKEEQPTWVWVFAIAPDALANQR